MIYYATIGFKDATLHWISSTEELLAICVITAEKVMPKETKFAAEEAAVIKEFADIFSSKLSNELPL
ncbi:2133_t:CDS:2 [Acaulospora colombiana]|uniref:2133_t:CDS:1 n=1 Tax=Acaulospora colombiana TaxID=27376 RepID=A0ACA9JV08_9GLOM|nr:2133_t:CDS:2 [Acaulospora colombiana]